LDLDTFPVSVNKSRRYYCN